jgi:hypothetical protein
MEPMTTEERFTRIENTIQSLTEIQARHDAGIRDLIVVSRTILESQKETTVQIQALASEVGQLREAQQATDEKLHILIETVDRIIRNLKK